MEILLIILAFLFGLAVGVLLGFLLLKYLQEKLLKKTMTKMSAGNDPMAMVLSIFDEALKAKKHA
jgi:uncharacterized membrane protein